MTFLCFLGTGILLLTNAALTATDGTFEFPLETGVFVPSPEESKKVGAICKEMFYSAPMKDRVQGGSTIDNKGGAIRSFNIDPTWEQTQIMVWSADVGKKSFKTNIEILQGPNCNRQGIELYSDNGALA